MSRVDQPSTSPRFSRRTALRLSAVGLVATTGLGVVESQLERNEITLRLRNWKANGYRIAQISDIHVNDPEKREVARRAVEMAVASRPDLLVFTGDFIDQGHSYCLANIVPAFEPLHDAKCPCLAIFGNHDYSGGVSLKIVDEVRKTKLKLLRNEAVIIDGIRVVGLDDAMHAKPDYGLVNREIADSTLVLLHEPDFVKHVPTNAALVLSGHSHGGEVCLPGGKPFYTPFGARKYESGYYPDAPVPVYVNRGIVTLGIARVYCPPEVTIFTLNGA